MTGSADTSVSESGSGADPEIAPPTDDWATAIAAQPPSSTRQAGGPAQGLLLRFRDQALERAYLQFEYERSKKIIVGGQAIGTMIMIGFLWIDPVIMPPEHLELVTSTRLRFMIPSALIALIGSIVIKDVRAVIPLLAFLCLIGGLWPSMLIVMSEGGLYQVSEMGVWNFGSVKF